jgi:hypothetical protein
MTRNTRLAVVLAVITALVVALPILAEVKQTSFPKADRYVLHSAPKFLVKVGDNQEIVQCKAELVLQTGTAYTVAGKRRVDLTVVDWKAEGTSKLLGGPIKFNMIKNGAPTADKSYVQAYETASAKSKDFPAHAQFVVRYEMETPFGVVSDLYGVTAGTIEAFPPQPGALFKMQKGDVAHIMSELMPEPLSAMTAAGEVSGAEATIEPIDCEDVSDPS